MMKKNELSKVVLSLLILFIGTLILDRTVGYAMNKGFGLLQNGANVTSKMKYTLYDMNAECVILGSSRANHHYITKTLSDSLNITVYNAGRDGHGLMYAAGLFCGFTSRYVPKLIIMEVGYDELEGGWSDKISNLKPFIKDFPCIENVQGELLGKNELIKNNLYSYRYNSMSINLMRSFFVSCDLHNGYVPLYGEIDKDTEIKHDSIKNAIDPKTRQILIDMCRQCKNRGIDVVAACSPSLIQYEYESDMAAFFNELDIPFFNYSNDTTFTNHLEFFRDLTHMNHNGAEYYTNTFIKDVMQMYSDRYCK